MNRNGILKTPKRKTPHSKLVDPIEVFCRVRPASEQSEETCVEIINDTTLQLNAPKVLKTISKVEQVKSTFNRVFPESTSQSELYDHVGLPLVGDLLNGRNGLCFMYGITGSGKTHTMNGTPSDGGVLPRCLDTIFNSIGPYQTNRCVFKPDGYNGFEVLSEMDSKVEAEKLSRQLEIQLKNSKNKPDIDVMRIPDSTTLEVDEDNNYAVFVSFVEVYNNSVFDLLDDSSLDPIKQRQPTSKILREDSRRNIFVYECTEIEVKGTEEAFEWFWKGQARRKTALTLLNAESSRSHCVFTIRLVQAPLNSSGDCILRDPDLVGISQLSLCDLAGSERTSRTKADGDQIRQAGHINNSLMTLRSCIETLRENQKSQEAGGGMKMVQYRDSKLTHLFKNYFDGDGKVRMIVCLNPGAEDFDESLHVMKFSEMTQEVKVARSEGVKFDLGLTPGRGKVSKMFREAVKDMEDGLSSDIGEQVMKPIQQFAAWPLLELTSAGDTSTLLALMAYLEERSRLRRTLLTDWRQKQEEVRQLIIQLEQDNIELTKALEDQKAILIEKEKENQTYRRKLKSLNDKDKHFRESRMEIEGKYFEKSEKLRQVLDVVQNFPPDRKDRINRIMQDERPTRTFPSTPSSAPSKSRRPPTIASKPPRTRTKSVTCTTPHANKPRSRSPPPTTSRTNKEAPLRAKHRRSRSSDYWLEHKPAETLSTDTVMQPNLRNKKTVKNPDVKDFKSVLLGKSAPNYILTHQEEDSSGEIETKLIKGEVMKTRGGGTSVQFTDVETLKKTLESKAAGLTSKTPKKLVRKRKSEDDAANSEDSWTSVETRCAIGIEGRPGAPPGLMHHALKKPKN